MGTLYLVATPLGNLEDITLRALRVLKEVDLIACEDTRHTAKLLTHYGIATPRLSYHEFNEASRTPQMLRMLREGKNIALVSDAGMPLISDPGYEIVAACRREGVAVIPLPGPSAAVAALAASGLPSDCFFFAGFLPSRAAARRRCVAELAPLAATLILYEAPHRLLATLTDLVEALGPRRVTLAREISKIHEEFLCGTLPELLALLRERSEMRGEITLVIEKGTVAAPPAAYPVSLREHLDAIMAPDAQSDATGYEACPLSRNEALKEVARARGISRREAYQQLQAELDLDT